MSDLRSKLIRLAHANPGLRSDLLPLLEKHAVDIDWENFGKKPVSVCQSYNQQGSRKGISALTQILESRLPATWKMTTDAATIKRVEQKWRSKARTVKQRGIDGKVVQHRGKKMFMGLVHGKRMVVYPDGFQMGKI